MDKRAGNKITDPKLIEFVTQGGNATMSVIVELAFKSVPISSDDPLSDPYSKHPITALPVDEAADRQRMDKLQSALERLTHGEIVRLDAAQAFVLQLTPEQLRKTVQISEVGSVRPNRMHRTDFPDEGDAR